MSIILIEVMVSRMMRTKAVGLRFRTAISVVRMCFAGGIDIQEDKALRRREQAHIPIIICLL